MSQWDIGLVVTNERESASNRGVIIFGLRLVCREDGASFLNQSQSKTSSPSDYIRR